MTSTSQTVICRYAVKPGNESKMEALLARHWPALHAAGLVTDDKPLHFRGLPSDKPEGQHGAASVYVEIFTWKTADGARIAHESPQIAAIWEPMGALCESMDFPHFERIELA